MSLPFFNKRYDRSIHKIPHDEVRLRDLFSLSRGQVGHKFCQFHHYPRKSHLRNRVAVSIRIGIKADLDYIHTGRTVDATLRTPSSSMQIAKSRAGRNELIARIPKPLKLSRPLKPQTLNLPWLNTCGEYVIIGMLLVQKRRSFS